MVVILRCSEEENTRRFVARTPGSKTKLTNLEVLKDIRENHFVYSFSAEGFKSPEVWEFGLDIEKLEPAEAAHAILELMRQVA